ncbi:MAG: EamA family transporter [Rubrivivax sp.]|nr:EamA family transporter [Rubrivivax sp.]
MPLRHAWLALAVVAVWGTNFVVIKIALGTLPPLLLAVLRFTLVLLPAALFIRRPAVPWHKLAAYGVLIGAGQFGLLYIAVAGRISPGLASLVVQVQVFFTIGLAMGLAGERLHRMQGLALVLATAGIVVIGAHTDADTTVAGLLLVVGAALAWAGGNQVARSMGRVDMLGVVVWSSAFALPPLLALTLWLEGPQRIASGLAAADTGVWLAVLWQSLGNSLFGYAAWGWLLARHPAATVVPVALLVPVFGMGASAWVLGEPLPAWKLLAAALVLAGLALNLLWPRLAATSFFRNARR